MAGFFKLKYVIFFSILFLYLSVSVYRLQDIPPPWHDEIIHLNIAKHVAEEGRLRCDFYSSKFNEDRLFVSMPLQWILLGAYIKIFGLNLFGARLIYVCMGMVTLCGAYLLAGRMFNKRIALYSFLLLASSYVFIHNSRQLIPQVPCAMFVVIAALLFYTAAEKKSRLLYAASGLSAGLAYLSHPLGLGISFIIIILSVYNKISIGNILSFLGGLVVSLAPYAVYVLSDFQEYMRQASEILYKMYPQQPMWLSILDEIPQRYFGLPPLKNAFKGLGGTGDYFTNLKHMVKNFDLRIYLCGIIAPASYLLSIIWLAVKKDKARRAKELLLLTAVYAALLSLHPNKFGPYIYVISPFASICLALLIDDLSRKDLLEKKISRKGILAFLLVTVFLTSNLALVYKELTTKKVPGYLSFIDRVKARIPKGSCVAGPVYFWIGMNKDYRYLSANEIEYKVDMELAEKGGRVKFALLSKEVQGAMIKKILSGYGIQYCLITCHNWDSVTEGPGLADGFGEALKRYLFYNAEKETDFLKENYYPGRAEAKTQKDELYFPPHDSIGFNNVSSEYQNSLKIYKIK